MSQRTFRNWAILVALILIAGLATVLPSGGQGSGTLYTFYATPAHQTVIGTQIFHCPGYPQYEDDAYMQSPFYTTRIVSCPAGGGGGGGGGEGDGEGEEEG
ncbi:MAG: hypothetical protein AAGN66_17560 [Acidobacteriota bacterium]